MSEKTDIDCTYLTDLSPSDQPWDANRAHAQGVEHLYKRADYQQYAARMHDCSRLLGFVLQSENTGDLRHKLKIARFCRVRHCPVCQWRRQMAWRARFFEAIPKFLNDYPNARFLFLTLTVQNCPLNELRDTVGGMNKAWKRMTDRRHFSSVLGWVKSVEVTRSHDDLAHPHFHVLMAVRPSYFTTGYVKQTEWREIWKQCLRVEYLPVVNIKTVKSLKGQTHEQINDALLAGLLETLKYSVKPSDLVGRKDRTDDQNAAWLGELTEQLHKTRAVAVGGKLRDYLSESEPEDSELISPEGDLEVSESELKIWYGWREMIQRYAKVDR